MTDEEMLACVGKRVKVQVCHEDGEAEPWTEGTLQNLGELTYEGDLFPELQGETFHMPCILLDDGRTVYGYECWWFPLEYVEQKT